MNFSWFVAVWWCWNEWNGFIPWKIFFRHILTQEVMLDEEFQFVCRVLGLVSVDIFAFEFRKFNRNFSFWFFVKFRARYPPYSDRKTSVLIQLLKHRAGIPLKYFGYLALFGLGAVSAVLLNKMVKNWFSNDFGFLRNLFQHNFSFLFFIIFGLMIAFILLSFWVPNRRN